MHLLHIVGARPNFMKLGPVYQALGQVGNIYQTVVHTGQHYATSLSDVFFQQLRLPVPDINLAVGSSTHARQTADIMVGVEGVIEQCKPDLVIVYGDVNSTVAAAMVCAKLGVRVAHVESGLRSFDRSMPEEINRIVTDQLSDLLFTPSSDANANLHREGIAPEKIHFVGNAMIDTLIRMLPAAKLATAAVGEDPYVLVTLHRPGNVDDLEWLKTMVNALRQISTRLPVLFPIHPRTRKRLAEIGVATFESDVFRFLQPLPYLEFLGLQSRATVVITDSGGIQEESTFLGVPCLTVRDNTERPITVTQGTNVLVGRDVCRLIQEVDNVLAGTCKKSTVIPYWDGKTGDRIAAVICHGSSNRARQNHEICS